jgi:hypothetical protein
MAFGSSMCVLNVAFQHYGARCMMIPHSSQSAKQAEQSNGACESGFNLFVGSMISFCNIVPHLEQCQIRKRLCS